MPSRTAVALAASFFALTACASVAELPPQYADAAPSSEVDQPAQLIECPGYAPLPSATRSLAVQVGVVVDQHGAVRHASVESRRTGTLAAEVYRERGMDSWQDLRSDAKRLAESCRFTPAVHMGELVPVKATVSFDFEAAPDLDRFGPQPCPPVEDKSATDTKSRPARCNG